MRRLAGALVFALSTVCPAMAEPPSFTAGVIRLSVPDVTPFSAFVFYPTETPLKVWDAGLFPVHATPGAPIAPGQRFPVVLFSHGGGNPLLHRDLAASLARNGFIVVMPIHGNTAQRLMIRPVQVRESLESLLADRRFAGAADPAHLGMIGYSLGGAVTLILAGGDPDFPRFAAYCRDHPDDAGACRPVRGTAGAAPDLHRAKARPLAAIVLLDPLAALFDAEGLADVQMPVLLYRPDHGDVLREAGNADALAAELPASPELHTVHGGHNVFVDPCPAALQADAECIDAPGVDREAVHRQLEQEIIAFLREKL